LHFKAPAKAADYRAFVFNLDSQRKVIAVKKFCLLMGLVMLAGLVRPAEAGAESAVRVIVSVSAPVFVKPDNKMTPLRVAKEGSILNLVADEGEWYRIEFDDPQFGRRAGYIEKRHVRVQVADPQQTVDPGVAETKLTAPNTFDSTHRQIDNAQSQAPTTLHATDKSRTRGFFVGGSYEGNGVVFEDGDETDSGAGFGVTLGYGFTPKLALYGQLSGASVDDSIGSYGLGYFDLGLRAHFRAPAKTVVPFVQAGLSARALSRNIGANTVEASGAGVAFGGGINAHFNPALAFTTGVTWSVGNFANGKVNGNVVDLDSFGMTSARVQVGIIWFPQSK
jgi:hypothetical protein